jgi:hypothetical protein
MDAPPRIPIFFLLAVLALTAALYGGGPRRSSRPPFVTSSIGHIVTRHQHSTPAPARSAFRMLRWNRLGGAISTAGRATITLLHLRRSIQVVVRSCARSPFVRSPQPTTRQIPNRYAPRSNRSASAQSGQAVWNPKPRASSSRPISFQCESAGSEIPEALLLVITTQSSMARDSRPGNSRCLYTAALATW